MINTTKAKADAEEGLRIAEKATEGPIDVHRYDGEFGSISYQLQQSSTFGMESVVLCDFDDEENPRASLDAAFYADSRTRAPEAYRNVLEMAGVIDSLNRRLGEAGELYGMALFDNERLTKERDDLGTVGSVSHLPHLPIRSRC